MPPDPISGRDVELIATGLFSLFAGGVWAVRPDGSVDAGPLVTFALLAVLSFSLAWVDIRSRGGRSVSREE